jgi:hypothetical protein
MNSTTELLNSPIIVALFSVTTTAFIAIAAAALRVVIQMARMQTELSTIVTTLSELKTDPDVMRWSNYGRAAQAFQSAPSTQGMQP